MDDETCISRACPSYPAASDTCTMTCGCLFLADCGKLACVSRRNRWSVQRPVVYLSRGNIPVKTLNADVIREALAGYAVANEVIEAERRKGLATMTDEEARDIDRQLYASWQSLPDWARVGLERLDLFQLESLLAMRRAFQRMAESRTDHESA